MKRIKDWDPDTPVVLACRPGLGDFFKKFGLADEIVAIDKKDKAAAQQTLAKLAQQKWDVLFVPHESPRTALMMRKLKAKHKVSFSKWWNGLVYDRRVKKPVDFPDALRQLSLLTPLDSKLAENFCSEEIQALKNPQTRTPHVVDFSRPVIPEWASMQVAQHTGGRHVIFMAPGSTWNTKRWTARGYVELARMLLARGYEIELVGSKAERQLCNEIEFAVLDEAKPGSLIANRAGATSLAELVERFRTGVALVSNDSGAMHAASAAGLPTVAIFGPTTLNLGFRPWQNRAQVVQLDLDCRPCGKHGHDKCPLGHHHCMEKIDALTVMKAVELVI
jgi:heptosyltransferase-2